MAGFARDARDQHDVTHSASCGLLRLGPQPRGLGRFEEFDVDDVGVAADGAIFNVALLVARGAVDGDDDRLAARRADV